MKFPAFLLGLKEGDPVLMDVDLVFWGHEINKRTRYVFIWENVGIDQETERIILGNHGRSVKFRDHEWKQIEELEVKRIRKSKHMEHIVVKLAESPPKGCYSVVDGKVLRVNFGKSF